MWKPCWRTERQKVYLQAGNPSFHYYRKMQHHNSTYQSGFKPLKGTDHSRHGERSEAICSFSLLNRSRSGFPRKWYVVWARTPAGPWSDGTDGHNFALQSLAMTVLCCFSPWSSLWWRLTITRHLEGLVGTWVLPLPGYRVGIACRALHAAHFKCRPVYWGALLKNKAFLEFACFPWPMVTRYRWPQLCSAKSRHDAILPI